MPSQFLTPLVDGTVANAQLAGNLCNRLAAGLSQAHRFAFKIGCIRLLHFCHDPCPPCKTVYPKIFLFYKSGAGSDEDYASSSIRLSHSILHKALDHAMKWGYVAKNVCELVTPPRLVRKRKPQFLTKEQALHLLESLR